MLCKYRNSDVVQLVALPRRVCVKVCVRSVAVGRAEGAADMRHEPKRVAW